MWLSASAFFSQYFRVYSPVSFGKQYDKDGAFIRHFLPVLKDMPAKYIYEPWTAPLEVQRRAGCVVGTGGDYPAPIVDHAVVMKANMVAMKAAYAAGGSQNSGEGSSGAGGSKSGGAGGSKSGGAGTAAKRPRKGA